MITLYLFNATEKYTGTPVAFSVYLMGPPFSKIKPLINVFMYLAWFRSTFLLSITKVSLSLYLKVQIALFVLLELNQKYINRSCTDLMPLMQTEKKYCLNYLKKISKLGL